MKLRVKPSIGVRADTPTKCLALTRLTKGVSAYGTLLSGRPMLVL